MPTFINNNHWCIALVDKCEKSFCWINPYDNSSTNTQKYLNLFLGILQKVCPDSLNEAWHIKHSSFVKQSQHDKNNYGVYVIYYTQQSVSTRTIKSTYRYYEIQKNFAGIFIEEV